MKVKNINGTSGNTCKCGTWLEHWSKFSQEQLPTSCPTYFCFGQVEVGAHVQKDNDNNWYIIPLCKTCNAKTGKELDIKDATTLVSANVSQTCGKKTK